MKSKTVTAFFALALFGAAFPALTSAQKNTVTEKSPLPVVREDAISQKDRDTIMSIAKKITTSAKERNWTEYCRLLTPHSRYNLILNIAKTKTCPEAFIKKKNLANTVNRQSKIITITQIKPLTRNVVSLDTAIPGDDFITLTALRYQGRWGADLHPPLSQREFRVIARKLMPGQKVAPAPRQQTSKTSTGGCVPSFLIKPIRRELSIDLNQQLIAPAAAKTGI